MIEINLGKSAGGKRSFENLTAVSNLFRSEALSWKEFIDSVGDDALIPTIKGNMIGWSVIPDMIDGFKDSDFTEQDVVNDVQFNLDHTELISYDGENGSIIRSIFDDFDPQHADAAMRSALPNTFAHLFPNADEAKVEGYLHFWLRKNSPDPVRLLRDRSEIRRYAIAVDKSFTVFQDKVDTINRDLEITVESNRIEIVAEKNSVKTFREDQQKAIAKDRYDWKTEWETLKQSFNEQIKLKSVVELWDERANAHELNYKKQRIWVISVGIAGLLISGLIAYGSIYSAELIFSRSIVGGIEKAAVGQVRPTLTQELVSAGAICLLYLTVYLWTMRVLVRSMMAEQHLGIDARSRGRMAHTYLALLHEGGANEEKDRAIVLASLFRPVTDGLVKDDALPLLSPAAIVSSHLAQR